VLTNRSTTSGAVRAMLRPNRALVLVVVVTSVALALSLSVPWLRGLFGFVAISWLHLAEAAGAAAACVVVNDLIGIVWRRVAATRRQTPMKQV
jgi:Ca2+-transporting ATPase